MPPLTLGEYFELLADSHSLPDLFYSIAKRTPDQVAYAQFVENGSRQRSASYAEVEDKVRRLADELSQIGVKKGDRVAICSVTRPEWMIADLAILSLGAISVSIYQTLNSEEMCYILLDSGSTVIFAENQEQLDKTLSMLDKQHLMPPVEGRPERTKRLGLSRIITFEETSPHPLAESLSSIFARSQPADDLPAIERSDLASLVYTSGTTGVPKGVIQSHGNHLSNLFQATRTELFALEGDVFLFLPLAHSFARLIGYVGLLSTAILRFPAVHSKTGSTVHIPSIMRDLRSAGAMVVPTVPRILEKIKSGIEERAAGKGISAAILRKTVASALEHYRTKGERGAFWFKLLTPIRRKIRRQLFGSRFEHLISGGAKLPDSVGEFFLALECMVYQGYGLTETCVATNVNLRDRHRPGSVGPCLYGVEVKIAPDGEILFRGPNIALGYWNRPAATKEAWDPDGFFHTGDLGHLDEDGFLWITGRKKELIVSSTGKKVVPAPIEEKLIGTGVISQAVVAGDGRSYCVVIVVPNVSAIQSRLQHEPSAAEIDEAVSAEIKRVNSTLSKHEELRKFLVIRDEFTQENGLLTPTFKVRRNQVIERYGDRIERLYEPKAV